MLYQVATEPTCPIWTGSSVVEQIPAKGMVVSSSLTRSVGFPTAWPLCRQRRKLNTYFQNNIITIITIITLLLQLLDWDFTSHVVDWVLHLMLFEICCMDGH